MRFENVRIIHGGQTGVDRGAHVGAVDAGFVIGGVMPKDGRDELGPIPLDVARHLFRCTIAGLSARTSVNVRDANALLVVVADKQDPYASPGTRFTLLEARDEAVPRLVVDPTDSRDSVVQWLAMLVQRHGQRRFDLMVAGPRASRWANGQAEAAAFVRGLRGAA